MPAPAAPEPGPATLRPSGFESPLPADHEARLVWAFVESRDLSAFGDRIRAVEHRLGRPPINPAILVALWLYATAALTTTDSSDGEASQWVLSAREDGPWQVPSRPAAATEASGARWTPARLGLWT